MSCLTWGWSSQWSGWCWVTDCCVSSADVLSVQTEPSDCGNKAGKTSLQNGYFLRAADNKQHSVFTDKTHVWRYLLPDTDIRTLFITYSHVHLWGINCGKKDKTITINQLSSYLPCAIIWCTTHICTQYYLITSCLQFEWFSWIFLFQLLFLLWHRHFFYLCLYFKASFSQTISSSSSRGSQSTGYVFSLLCPGSKLGFIPV